MVDVVMMRSSLFVLERFNLVYDMLRAYVSPRNQ